jgi:predicted transcriptional regulator
MSGSNTKVTVNLPDVVVQELKELAKTNNVSMTDLIAQSIRLNKFLSDREREGGKILVEGADRKIERIIRK